VDSSLVLCSYDRINRTGDRGALALRLTQKGTRKMAAAPRQASSMVAEKSIGNRSLRSKTLLVACHAERLNQRNTKLGRGPTKVLGLFELAKRNSAHGPGLALT
jgi:hypothetical protein